MALNRGNNKLPHDDLRNSTTHVSPSATKGVGGSSVFHHEQPRRPVLTQGRDRRLRLKSHDIQGLHAVDKSSPFPGDRH
jgi:hypothetical protein